VAAEEGNADIIPMIVMKYQFKGGSLVYSFSKKGGKYIFAGERREFRAIFEGGVKLEGETEKKNN